MCVCTGMEVSKLQKKKKKWWYLQVALSVLFLVSCFLILVSYAPSLSFLKSSSSDPGGSRSHDGGGASSSLFVESKLRAGRTSDNPVPRLAYLISGSRGDGETLKRTLRALYHPRNQYVVHLDLEAPPEERLGLATFVRDHPLFAKLGNVRVVARSNLVTYPGPTMVSNTLHGASILLKEGGEWDWFINLSASDYPLVTQDDLLRTFSGIPRHLNFIEHTSDIGWKESQRAKPVIIDPGLYSLRKQEVFWVTEKRSVPTAFRLFTGSAWMMLSRPFMEFCLWGWDNLPRVVLMYYTNFLSSPEGYFHTVICNAEEFQNTTVNHDLHFISWDNPPKQHPHFLTASDYQSMVDSNTPFARKFRKNEPILDKIDSELLGRQAEGFVPGGWFDNVGHSFSNVTVPRHILANATSLRPGPGATRIRRLIKGLLSVKNLNAKQCK